MPSYDYAAQVFLGISQLRGVGFKTLRELGGVQPIASHFTSLGAARLVERISKEPIPGVEARIIELGEHLVEKLRSAGVQMVRIDDPLYPQALLDLPAESRPLWLFVRGNYELLNRQSVSVVGTRAPTPAGRFLTQFAVAALAECDATIVSGLAKGVDEAAHEWALTCGIPTLSVMGTGLLRTYPATNVDLADRIVAAGGLLLSEYLPSEGPKAENFVHRNRIQAALGACVVAPEWNRQSGTAHTIRFARALRRPTINLRLANCPGSPDAGVADECFRVPRQQSEFVAFVKKELAGNPPIVQQQQLFPMEGA